MLPYDFGGLLVAAEFAELSVAEQTDYLRNLDKGREVKKALDYKWNEGLQQGREEGRAEGMQQALHATAINMLASGMSVEDISQMTGLTPDEIRAIGS